MKDATLMIVSNFIKVYITICKSFSVFKKLQPGQLTSHGIGSVCYSITTMCMSLHLYSSNELPLILQLSPFVSI